MLAIRRAQLALGLWRYPIALAGALLGVALRVFFPHFLQGYGFITIFPMIMFSALLLGWRAGMLTLVLGMLGIWFVVLPEPYSFTLRYRNDAIALAVFTAFSLCIIWGCAAFERLLARIESERAEAEAQSARNAMLLAELRHRVGNVLQFVLALVAVRRRATDNVEARRILDDTIDSIHLLARAQAALHDSDNARMDDLLRDVCRGVTEAAPQVAVSVDASERMPHRDAVVPILLAANEMLMNAVEHAFPGGAAGRVEVGLAAGPDAWVLTVRDDGAGLPEGFLAGSGPRQGLKIIAALARQAGGSFSIENRTDAKGTLARLTVPIPAP